MKCFSDDYDKVTVGWTVKAKEKPSTVDWGRPSTVWLSSPSGPMAPRYGWSVSQPEYGFTDVGPSDLLQEAKSCTYPTNTKPDRRTLKLVRIEVHEVYERETEHVTPSELET